MKALTEPFKILVRVTGLNYLIGDEFQFAAPSMQPQCAIERARVDT